MQPHHQQRLLAAKALIDQSKAEEAFPLLEALAAEGLPEAMHLVAACLLEGVAGQKDAQRAVHWLEQAGRAGLAESKLLLARLQLDGQGTPHRPEEALRLLEEAARDGHAEAARTLARIYQFGFDGVPPELAPHSENAVHWHVTAARLGSDLSRYSLALMYLGGEGVAPDPVVALAWLFTCPPSLHEDVRRNLLLLCERLEPEQVLQARQMSQELGQLLAPPRAASH